MHGHGRPRSLPLRQAADGGRSGSVFEGPVEPPPPSRPPRRRRPRGRRCAIRRRRRGAGRRSRRRGGIRRRGGGGPSFRRRRSSRACGISRARPRGLVVPRRRATRAAEIAVARAPGGRRPGEGRRSPLKPPPEGALSPWIRRGRGPKRGQATGSSPRRRARPPTWRGKNPQAAQRALPPTLLGTCKGLNLFLRIGDSSAPCLRVCHVSMCHRAMDLPPREVK